MADDVQANIGLNIDTSKALTGLKALQSELSALHTQLSRLGPTQRAQAAGVQRSLIDNINATGKFAASMTTVRTTAESFTNALEKNKLTMGEYFRYAGGASKSFGRNFAREFATIEKVAVERVKSLQTQYIKLGRDANGAMRSIAVRPLTLDMDNLQTKTAIAAQKQQLLNQLLKQGSTQMLNWGKNTQWAGRQLMVGFTIPLGIFAGQAMKAFSDMEKQIISFKRVYGDLSTSAKDTDAMAESIRKLAGEFTKYGLAVSDTMEMASKAAAMGKTGADLLGQVQQASKLAVLGQVEQQQALQTTISLTDTFGTAAEDLGKKINFLNAVENQTAVSIEDLTIAIPKAGPVIKQLGGDVEDLAFFLTAMREGGINASEGANALKSGLAAMINPTGKAAEMLQGFGINLQKIVKTNKGDVKGTVVEFAKALDTLDPLNRAKAIEQLFGKFQFARISTLMKNVVSDSSQAATTAQLAQRSSVELAALAARELRQLSSSPLYKFQKAIQDFQTQLAPIGESFMKFVTPIIDFVNGLLKSFNSLGEGTKTFIVGFTSVVAGLGPILLMTFGLVANGFANLIKGFAALKSVFNRVQTSSEILGQETRYMTEEQIKAKAVAASLDQVHGKLIQTFNVEAGSVNKLASAYERAVLASQRLMPVATGGKGKGAPVKKFASGGMIYGPGTGTSDSIPAMVSNGEFIMPAKQTAKYRPFLDAMSQNRLPGFAGKNGNVPGEKPKRVLTLGDRLKKKTISEYAPKFLSDQSKAMEWKTKNKELSIMEDMAKEVGIDLSSKESIGRRDRINYMNVDASHLKEDVTQRDIGFGQTRGIKNWRSKNLFADWGSINKSINDIKSGNSLKSTGGKVKAIFAERIEEISKSLKMDPKEVDKISKDIFKGNHIVNQKQRAVGEKIMQLAFENAVKPQEKLKYGSAQRILQSRAKSNFYDANEVAKRSYKITEDQNARHGNSAVRLVSEELARATPQERAAYIAQSQSKVVEGEKQVAASKRSTRAKEETAKADEKVAKSSKETAKEYLARAREERKLGKKTLTLKQKRVLAEYDAQRAAISARARETRERNRSTRVSQSYLVSGVDQYMVDENGSTTSTRGRRRSARTPRPPKGPGMFSKVAPFLGFGKDARNTRATSVGGFLGGGRLFGLGSAVSIGGSMLGSAVGGEAGNAIMGGSQIAGGLSMAAEFMPKLAMGIARFIPHIAVATAVFAGLSAVVSIATKEERDRVEKQKSLNSAMDAATGSAKSVADFFGRPEKNRGYFQKTSEDVTGGTAQAIAVDEYKKTEGFKSDYGTLIEGLKGKTKEEADSILQALAIKLGPDYAAEEVGVVIEAIRQEAKLTDVDLEFKTLDFSTEKGAKKAVKTITSYVQDVAKTTVSDLGKIDIGSASGTIMWDQDQILKIQRYAAAVKQSMLSLRAAFDDGKITADQYSNAIQQIGKNLDDMSDTVANQTLFELRELVLKTTDDKLLVGSIKNRTTQYKVLTAAIKDYGKAMAYAAQIQAIQTRMNKFQSLAMPTVGQIGQYKKDIKSLKDINKLLDLIAESRTDIDTGNDDPYKTEKETLNKEQQARQKQAQDGLAYLGLLEDDINKKYDKRIEALDKVAELNKEIAASQRDQLDLADALSRGDIAAAARAAQTMRANDTQREFDRQKEAIETARSNEVNGLKVKIDGVWYTKDQLEAKNRSYELKSASNAISNNRVKFAAGGGKITGPGTGTSDDIPAMLSNGEYVIRAKAVKALGVDTLDKMNHAEKFGIGGFARRYAKGGPVSADAVERWSQSLSKAKASAVLPQMLKTTKLVTRTTQDTLLSMIEGDRRYRNAFETGRGADFTDINVNTYGKDVRLGMEKNLFDIPRTAPASARPTYGALVTESKSAQLLNKILGGMAGKQFNQLANINSKQLDLYGDISLIGKRGLKNRSTFFTGDTFEESGINPSFGKRLNFSPVPVSGKPSDILSRAGLNRLEKPFGMHPSASGSGFTNHRTPRYLETQTPQGFTLDDIAKIRVHGSDQLAKDTHHVLRSYGIKTKVYGPSGKVGGFASIARKLLRSLGRIGGPEGMFLADALLGTSSMQMPSLPGQSKSPFASGAYAMGGMVGKYSKAGISGYADGGMVGPRNALMADAAERSFNKPVFKPKKKEKNWFEKFDEAIQKDPMFKDFDPTLLGNSNGMGTEWLSGIDTGNSLVRTLSGKGDFGDNLSSAMLPFSFLPGLGKGAAVAGKAGSLAKVTEKAIAGNRGAMNKLARIYSRADLGENIKLVPQVQKNSFGPGFYMTGNFLDKTTNQPVGNFSRTFENNNDGMLAYHNFLQMELPYRGKGIGSKFGSFSEELYKQMGVKKINVQAGLTDGGKTWAQAGYEFRNASSAEVLIDQISDADRWSSVTKNDSAATALVHDIIERASKFEFGSDGFPTANEIVNLSTPGTPRLGAELMKGTQWQGVKYLDSTSAKGLSPFINKMTAADMMGLTKDQIVEFLSIVKSGAKSLIPKPKPKVRVETIDQMLERVRNTSNTIPGLENLPPPPTPEAIAKWEKLMGIPDSWANGGMVSKIKPSYFNVGGLAKGTDTIPAMLTPGEFVMTRSAVQNFGVDNLKSINSGDVSVAPSGSTSSSDSVYNYSINVNVSSMSDPNDIAKTVMTQIKRIDSQKVRGIYRG
jgi:TP901 family phage tail tape measure protein